MTVPVETQRVLQGAAATISVTLQDQNGEPRNAGGAVTVKVTRADGTIVLAAGTATAHGATGVYSVNLTAAQTASLDLLTAVWTEVGGGSRTTTIAVVGGYYFSVADARKLPGLEDSGVVTTETILEARSEVEWEAERIIGAAFVPQYRMVSLWGGGSDTIKVPDRLIRTVRSISFAGVALSSGALENVVGAAGGTITRYWPTLPGPQADDWSVWGDRFPSGTRITVGYEHGLDAPPPDLKSRVLRRLQSTINRPKSGIPDHAVTFTAGQGGTFSLATPGAGRWQTGIPEVDVVYFAYRDLYAAKQTAGSVPIG